MFVAGAVHSLTAAKDVFSWFVLLLAEECSSLHIRGNLDTGDAQHRRGKVDEVNKVVADSTGFDLSRPADNKWYVKA